jgi:hypothetical protein
MTMLTLIEIKPLDGYRLWCKFANGTEGIADLSHLAGQGVFALWNDYREFQKARVTPDGAVAWGDEIDICPDALYLRITGKKPEELFPKLHELLQYA